MNPYDAERTLGSKRNYVYVISNGVYNAYFDDDDYYAPPYWPHMITQLVLHNADVVKLARFYVVYAPSINAKNKNITSVRGALLQSNLIGTDASLMFGYGFVYVYKKTVTKRVFVPPINWGKT